LSCGRETGFSDLASERLSDLTSQSINPSIIQALCHFKSISEKKGPTAKTLTEVQNCFTTKEEEALDPALKLGCVVAGPVYYTPRGNSTQPITAFDSSSNSILRVLRGEFSSTSGLALQPALVLCEPKLEVTTHSCLPHRHRQAKRHGTVIRLSNLKWALEN